MELPKDPMMLFSVINMKLRDCYSSLDELCEDMNVDKDELVNQLKAVGFELMWLKNKRHFYQSIYEEDANRIVMLEARYKKLIKEAGGNY